MNHPGESAAPSCLFRPSNCDIQNSNLRSAIADPFTALGVAGNIITFVDFTWKLFSGAHAIYRSQSGSSDKNAVLEVIARDVSTLSDAIVVEQSQSEALRSLATKSKRVAEKVLEALEKLKVQGSNSRWKSLKVALKEVWSHSEIDGLEKALSALQSQVTSHVQYLMGQVGFIPGRVIWR